MESNQKSFDVPWQEWLENISLKITDEQPQGRWLRYESEYDEIRKARRADDPTVPQGIWKSELKEANWQKVADICLECLTTKTKDLQIAAWLLEAWTQLYQVAGLAMGLEAVVSLISNHWSYVYPALQEEDEDSRFSPIEWLNEKFPDQILTLSIANIPAGGIEKFCFANWIEFNHYNNQIKKNPHLKEALAKNQLQLAALTKAVEKTPVTFYQDLQKNITECLTKVQTIEEKLMELHPDRHAELYRLRNRLTEVLQFCSSVLKDRGNKGVLNTDLQAGVTQNSRIPNLPLKPFSPNEEETVMTDNSRITSRQQAYEYLDLIADFLAETEPHSPTSYLIRRAAGWGRKSLDQVLGELLEIAGDMEHVKRLLGMGQK